MPRAGVHQRADRARADIFSGRSRRKLPRQLFGRHGQEFAKRVERPPIRAAIVEHAEEPWKRDASQFSRSQKTRDFVRVEVADDLREIELRVETRIDEEIDLSLRIGVRVRPAAERDRVTALPQHLAQLPGMPHAARNANRFVAAEDDERRESVLLRAFGVRETVVERVLRG